MFARAALPLSGRGSRALLAHAACARRHGRTQAVISSTLDQSDSATAAPPAQLPPCFDLQRTLLLAAMSFEAYHDPSTQPGVLVVNAKSVSVLHFAGFERARFCYAVDIHVERFDFQPSVADVFGWGVETLVVGHLNGSAGSDGGEVRCSVSAGELLDARGRLYVRSRASMRDTPLLLRAFEGAAADKNDRSEPVVTARLSLAGLPLDQPTCVDVRLHRTPRGEEEDSNRDASPADGGSARLWVRVSPLPPPPRVDGPADGFPVWKRVAEAGAAAIEHAAADAAAADANTPSTEEPRKVSSRRPAQPQVAEWARLALGCGSPPLKAFHKIAFVEHARTDTQACVWRAAAHRTLVVAFRGTVHTSIGDVATDLKLLPRVYHGFDGTSAAGAGECAVKVHDGFLTAWEGVRDSVLSLVGDATAPPSGVPANNMRATFVPWARPRPWRVFVTGHSLGGALATLCAGELAAAQIRRPSAASPFAVSMVNFGSPRVGTAAFASAFDALVPDSVRAITGSDGMSELPALLGYRHVSHGVRFGGGAPRLCDREAKEREAEAAEAAKAASAPTTSADGDTRSVGRNADLPSAPAHPASLAASVVAAAAAASSAAFPSSSSAAAPAEGLLAKVASAALGGAAEVTRASSAFAAVSDLASMDDHMEASYLAVLTAAAANAADAASGEKPVADQPAAAVASRGGGRSGDEVNKDIV